MGAMLVTHEWAAEDGVKVQVLEDHTEHYVVRAIGTNGNFARLAEYHSSDYFRPYYARKAAIRFAMGYAGHGEVGTTE